MCSVYPPPLLEWHLLAVFTFQIGYWSSLIRSRVVALPLASLSSGVRLAMVIIVVFFVFSFLTFLSQSSLSTVANSVFRCCSPFSSHAVQVCLNAVLPLACSVFLASFPSTFCVTGCHLPFFPHGRSISSYCSPFLYKTSTRQPPLNSSILLLSAVFSPSNLPRGNVGV